MEGNSFTLFILWPKEEILDPIEERLDIEPKLEILDPSDEIDPNDETDPSQFK